MARYPKDVTQPAQVLADESPAHRREDAIVVIRGASWADYRRLLELRGEHTVPRLTYLEGTLELMNPSRWHESIKSTIGRLVEAWCFETGIDISPYGSWTLQDEAAERGLEPDECYVVGDVPAPDKPDLAIEVVWTSGGIGKLDVYRKLGIAEVWIWRNERIRVHVLEGTEYIAVPSSRLLSGIDLDLLARYIAIQPMTRAVRQYREALRERGVR